MHMFRGAEKFTDLIRLGCLSLTTPHRGFPDRRFLFGLPSLSCTNRQSQQRFSHTGAVELYSTHELRSFSQRNRDEAMLGDVSEKVLHNILITGGNKNQLKMTKQPCYADVEASSSETILLPMMSPPDACSSEEQDHVPS